MKITELSERQRRLILDRSLTDVVLSERLGICRRTIARLRARLQEQPA